ncbi:hypothetical protein [Fulvivirga kasyanovii]|uniref:hypothetical protein n=2 Tax=Fulvivirga kasyanovii TaxID=396812 RepID=UPI0031DDDD5D
MKHLTVAIFCLLTLKGVAQAPSSLSEQLWQRAQKCYSMFEDYDEDGKVDYGELIDDARNGYLKVSGSFPTCGCSCTSEIGAYKDQSGQYTFIEKETWSCSWTERIHSNKEIESILPDDLITNGFFSGQPDVNSETTPFFLEVEIPRVGTDTRVALKLIPFGLKVKSKSIVAYDYSEEGNSSPKPLYGISRIAGKVSSSQILDYIVKGHYDKIPASDLSVINQSIGEDYDQFASKAELSKHLRELKTAYELYSLIKHNTLLLKWNRDTGKFSIKEKGAPPKPMSFSEFLTGNMYWAMVC